MTAIEAIKQALSISDNMSASGSALDQLAYLRAVLRSGLAGENDNEKAENPTD